MKPGDLFELTVTPELELTHRYAEASGDDNPIHLDEEIARSVGLPGRILHGLWTMAQVARLHTEAAGNPVALKRLRVEFRGLGLPGEEIGITATVSAVEDGIALVDSEARQAGRRIIRNGAAELAVSR
jgi:acyl dehydratase